MAKENKPVGLGIKIAIAIGSIVIIGLIVTVVILVNVFLKKENTQEAEETKRNVVVTQDNVEQIAEELINETYVAPGYYSTQMSTEWHFSSGDAISDDGFVKNDIGNTNDVYFDVFLKEDESTPIFESPIIPRGAELNSISLDTKLDAGTYDCVMVYHLVDEDQNTVSTLRVAFTIVVES